MREYTKCNICGSINPVEFQQQLSELITEFQVPGYEVEIQFQTNNKQYYALVLQYKEKPRFF